MISSQPRDPAVPDPAPDLPIPGHRPAAAAQSAPAWFDADFYLLHNPDADLAGTTPYAHFHERGWREFRNPSADFDLWWYCIWHLGSDLERDPGAHYEAHGQALGLSTALLASQRLEVAQRTEFNTRSLALFKRLEAPPQVLARIAANLARMELWEVADMIAVRACALDPDDAANLVLLARIVAKRGGWRRAVDPLRKATRLDDRHPAWFHELGYACERLDWLDEAIDAYRKALALHDAREDTLYRLGYLYEQRGAAQDAAGCYERLAAINPQIAQLGVGALHAQENDWSAAEAAYARRAGQAGAAAPAALHFAHGVALEMLMRWEDAEAAYRRALAADPGQADWHYRRAYMLERLERHAEAADVYAQALQLREDADWRYRQASSLFGAGDALAAIAAWLRCLPGQPEQLAMDEALAALHERRHALRAELAASQLDPDAHYQLGTVCERLGLLAEAAEAYRSAARRRGDHRAGDHYRLGAALYRLGELAQACHALQDTRLYRRDFSHLPQPPEDIKTTYAEFLDTLEVDDGIVLYESFHGASVSCNPLAVFRRAYRRFAGSGRLHVWAVKSDASVPPEYAALPDVVFVRHGSALYARYLATAGWLVNNNTFMPYFVRRPQQRYLNVWHGTPLKKLGADIPGALFDHKNCTRNLLQVTHLAAPNAHTWHTLLHANQVRDVFAARVAETGHARIDLMLNATDADRARLRERLGVASGERVVLYAPTWRGSLGGASLDTALVAAAIEHMVRPGVALLFSAHHLVARKLGPLPAGARAFPNGVDITEALAIVDVLVTDYSSILFDYLPSRRPLILHVPDAEQYARERGLYRDIASLPARFSRTPEALASALTEALAPGAAPAAALQEALAEYCAHEDGAAGERVLDFFFDDARVPGEVVLPPTGKRSLLFQAGNFNPNGVTASFNRLVSQLDPAKFSVAVVADPWSMESYPQRLQRYAELPAHVQRWGRVSHPVTSVEDQWLHQRLGMPDTLAERAQRQLDRILAREYRRQFGSARIDAAIDFAGYTAFWTGLFARGRPHGVRALTYLHNDMRQEAATRHPQLARVFRQYRYCDALVSVSQSLHEVNASTLADCVEHDAQRFRVAENCIDPDFIRANAQAPVPEALLAWRRGHVLIGSVGRLSPEKGHARLLDAFAALRGQFPQALLVIAGEGAEKPALLEQIARLGLSDTVRLLGALENPYPLMRELDLFVLPSLYEGQAIVLLEALTLGTPVLSTDIPGPHSVLAGDRQRLVDNSTQGLFEGMRRWLATPAAGQAWDAQAYARSALAQFERVVATAGAP
ncbi:CDP-glycerol glycerophosphotransferase family protein [Xanthomonas sp. 1678]|uniref:CDP-glycerol glycerophosphotransferase family protein n=1 Tax=Xanthomonas sp. 1678 TaxID=3158788 RepID=UPI00285C110B|nr:CDP-glycerol glycerophosphotransferase [Xanthomonas translucens]